MATLVPFEHLQTLTEIWVLVTCWKRADASQGRNESFPLIIYLNQIQKFFQLPVDHLLKTVHIGFLEPTITSDNGKHLPSSWVAYS